MGLRVEPKEKEFGPYEEVGDASGDFVTWVTYFDFLGLTGITKKEQKASAGCARQSLKVREGS